MGKKEKKYGPSVHPASSFQLRGGGGNMNPYAKMADKGLINPLMKRLPKEERKAKRVARRKARTGEEKFRLGTAIASGIGVIGAGIKTAIDVRRGAPLSGPLAELFK